MFILVKDCLRKELKLNNKGKKSCYWEVFQLDVLEERQREESSMLLFVALVCHEIL